MHCKNLFYNFAVLNAQVAELVDALDSKSSFFGSVGSIPTLSTKKLNYYFGSSIKVILLKSAALLITALYSS